jgi:hypothetical protein
VHALLLLIHVLVLPVQALGVNHWG